MNIRLSRTLCRVLLLFCTYAAASGWSDHCLAKSVVGEGRTTFSIYPQLLTPMDSHRGFMILISMRGNDYPKDVTAIGRLHFSSGLQVVSGDTVHVAHVSDAWDGAKDNLWRVYVRASSSGSYDVYADMRAEVTAVRIDEMESRMKLIVDGTGVREEGTETLREETIRGGQRYRLGGFFMVPIAVSEEVTNPRLTSRASVGHRVDGVCAKCEGSARQLPFLVFINADGTIHSYEFMDTDTDAVGATPDMVRSAEAALQKWSFVAAKFQDRSVADWVIVRVAVHP